MYEMGKLFSMEVDRMKVNYVSIVLTPAFYDIRLFKWNDFLIEHMTTYEIDLQRPLDTILRSFSSSKKDLIKKMDRYDLKLVESTDISIFYESSVERYREQGLRFPVVSKGYLEELLRIYPEQIKLYYIEDENSEKLGGLMTTEYRKMTMWIGNAKPHVKVPVNEFSYWELIRKAKAKGYDSIELGELISLT